MGSSRAAGPNKWNSTPRKVFDATLERVYLKISRVREDYRADIALLVKRIIALEERAEDPLEDDEQ